MRMRYHTPMLRVLCPLGAGFCLLLSSCRGGSANPAESQPTAVAVAAVQRGEISHLLSLAGQFEPYQVVQVHAKVSGYIQKINVDIGDRVHKGETLATLEVPELNAQYRASASEALRSNDTITAAAHDVARARSLHTALQTNYGRLQRASDAQPGMIAAQELDNARSQADASAAQVDAALATLSGAKQGALTTTADRERVGALQSYTRITAPLSGVITWRYADTGALVQAGTSSDKQSLALVTLSQSDLLRLRVPVPEDAVRYVHIGDSMQIRVDALGKSFTGKVVRFTRNLDPQTRTMETEVDVPNPDLTITPGMYANTYLQLAHVENALTVPVAAVQTTGGASTAMVATTDNTLESRKIQVGLRGALLVQIVSGLEQGDRVVLGASGELHAGERVTPRLQPEAASDVMHEEGGMTDEQSAQGASE
jgi:RND family efflux transporter MFP subunit